MLVEDVEQEFPLGEVPGPDGRLQGARVARCARATAATSGAGTGRTRGAVSPAWWRGPSAARDALGIAKVAEQQDGGRAGPRSTASPSPAAVAGSLVRVARLQRHRACVPRRGYRRRGSPRRPRAQRHDRDRDAGDREPEVRPGRPCGSLVARPTIHRTASPSPSKAGPRAFAGLVSTLSSTRPPIANATTAATASNQSKVALALRPAQSTRRARDQARSRTSFFAP